jgi:hypothetical protein
MDQDFASHSHASERAELELVLAALARNPRLASLLSFLAERYFQSRTEEINEYNIATEVFDRSKTSFDASRDSIARVEAYRLRKRLKEYYESEGKTHEIWISLPSGSYIPRFSRRSSSTHTSSAAAPVDDGVEIEDLSYALDEDAEETSDISETGAVESGHTTEHAHRKRTLLVGAAGIVAVLLLSFIAVRFFSPNRPGRVPDANGAHPQNAAQPSSPDAPQVPLRLLAGYDGTPRIDSAGVYWQADRYFHGGGAFRRPDALVEGTSDPMLFERWRTGDFTYDIPLAPGPYELHLYFVATQPSDFKTAFFNVNVNGQPLLRSFNISSDALGANIADERIFKDIYPDKEGFLHLKFFMDRAAPSLNALEILPGLPHRQLPVRLVMQQAAVTDHAGNTWHPDNYFQNGTLSDPPQQISGTPDPGLYAQERFGHFAYSIPVDTRGRYTLILHFAEHYWIPNPADSVGVGSRVFRVYCNGTTLLDNFDILKEAGSLHALTKTFYHLRPSSEGKLDLTFEPIENYATVSAIEVIDESE